MKEINEKCIPLSFKDCMWEEKRPEGFPSQRAYFGNPGQFPRNPEAYAEYCVI
jgi:hypothetical protein